MPTTSTLLFDSLLGANEPNIDVFRTDTVPADQCSGTVVSTAVTANGLELNNAPYLVTQQDFDPVALGGIVVDIQWQWSQYYDFAYVRTRDAGIPDTYNRESYVSGIGFSCCVGCGNLRSTSIMCEWNGPQGFFFNYDGAKYFNGDVNQWYDIRVIDTGTQLVGAIRPTGDTVWSVISYANARYRPCSNKVTFFNRRCGYSALVQNFSIKKLAAPSRPFEYSPAPYHCSTSVTATVTPSRSPSPVSVTPSVTMTPSRTATPVSYSVTATPVSFSLTPSITPTESLTPSVTPSQYLDPNLPRGATYINDPLINTVPNPVTWNQVVGKFVPACTGTLAELLPTSQGLDITNRAYLVTAQDFDPALYGGIVVSGYWTFFSYADFLQILTRSDGIPNGYYSEDPNGITFFCFALDGYANCEFGFPENDESDYWTDSDSFSFQYGTPFEFQIIDTGTYLMAAVRAVPNYSESASSSESPSETRTQTPSTSPTISVTSSPVSITVSASATMSPVSNTNTGSVTGSVSNTNTATASISVSRSPVSVTQTPSTSPTPVSQTNTGSPSSTPYPWQMVIRGYSAVRNPTNKVVFHNRECEFHSRVSNIQISQLGAHRSLDKSPGPIEWSVSTTPMSRSVSPTPSISPALFNSLAGWWQFNTPNAGLDSSVNSNTLIPHNVVTVNGYGVFESDSWLGMPGDAGNNDQYYYDPFYLIPKNLPVGDSSFTIAARVKLMTGGSTRRGFVSWGSESNGANEIQSRHYTQISNDWTNSYSYSISTPNLQDGYWHCVALTYDTDSEERTWYIDGSPAGQEHTYYGQPNILGASFRIGVGFYWDYFFGPGVMDHIAIWGRPLAMEELQAYHIQANDMSGCGSSLVALYRFDTPGEIGFDSGPRGNNLTATEEGAYQVNGTLLLDGGYLFVNVEDSNIVPRGTPIADSSYTIAMRIKLDGSQGAGGLVGWGSFGDGNSVNAFRLDGDSTLINYWWGNDLFAYLDYSLNDGKWHPVAVTYDRISGIHVIYVDHVKATNETRSSNPYVYPDNFRVGSTNFGEYFTGQIDDLAIWNRALSQLEVYHFFVPLSNTPTPSITPTISLSASVTPVASGNGGTEGIGAVGDNAPPPLEGYKIAIIVVCVVVIPAIIVAIIIVVVLMRKKKSQNKDPDAPMTDLEMQEPSNPTDGVPPHFMQKDGGALSTSAANLGEIPTPTPAPAPANA